MKALFLDRDDTLIPDAGYMSHPGQVSLFADVREALHLLRPHFRFFLFSNQSGIGRGYMRLEDAKAVNRRMERLVGLPEPLFDAVCMPPEPPGTPSRYRKPAPAFILEALAAHSFCPASCWMLGDRLSDLQAGINAGIRAALLRTPDNADDTLADYLAQHAIPRFPDLLSFALFVLPHARNHPDPGAA